ncbi:RNA-binding domain-containing protein [Acinetobacter indicus]|uniref:RNA-binding domain-containing protein n=1 Tax=Acinetobacter indicus TaxID=756892 RepID=UPI000CEC6A46|nr:RNA-binding domain-containing protein [Acinetobacter indicus]
MTLEIKDLFDLQTLAESEEVEFKLAAGQDGNGALPKDFWSSYSALANSRGGWIILGVREKKGHFTIEGVKNYEKVRTDLFNQLNDKGKVSVNLLQGTSDAEFINFNGKTIIAIRIRAASRTQKPVYLNKSPLGNTYIRQDDGDRQCDEITVKRMLAEQLYESRDNLILSEHYSFEEDINQDSLKSYRNLLSSHNPQHPFLELDLKDFFKKIGGWRKDRETGVEGITLAGMLMFGEWEAITSAAPNYFIDYQERPEAKTENRWIDRVVPDGTWSGNLFDFYRKVFSKITSDLKIPFVLQDGQRKGDTPVHTALREALVNTIVHSDYSEPVPLLIVKRPDLFGFRNPGIPRIPLEDIIEGGVSDCRNRLLHQMFLLVGLGERAGSGMPKIFSGWKSVNWRTPKIWEKQTPAQTILELSTASLIPEDALTLLDILFGDQLTYLTQLEILILTTALIEGWVNHERACQLTSLSSRDVSASLAKLTSRDFLVSSGEYKQKIYTLPGTEVPSADQIFAGVELTHNLNLLNKSNHLGNSHSDSSTYNGSSSTYNADSSTYNGDSSTDKDEAYNTATSTHERDQKGRLISEHFDAPYIDSLTALDPEFREFLFEKANESRTKRRLSPESMTEIILRISQEHYISASALATILDRNANSIRQQYLTQLVDQGKLKLAVPQYKNDPRQGYMACSKDQ